MHVTCLYNIQHVYTYTGVVIIMYHSGCFFSRGAAQAEWLYGRGFVYGKGAWTRANAFEALLKFIPLPPAGDH